MTTTVKEFIVALENKPGTLAEVAGALGKANVNITGFQLQAQGDFGQFRFTTSDPAKTEGWLRTTKHAWRARDAVAAPAANKPGELGRLAQKLAASGVNVEATYHVFPSSNESQILFSVSDVQAAVKALG
jgi:hypothetical protein